MAHRQTNVPQGRLFITLLIIAVAVQVVPHRHTKRLNIFFLSVFRPVLNLKAPGFSRIVRSGSSNEGSVPDSEYDRLYTTYKNTHAALTTMQQKYETLSRIRSGLPRLGTALVLARVITPTINNFTHEMVINEGKAAGVQPGQLVVSWNASSLPPSGMESCVIGSISEVRETTATVQLLTDSRHTLMVSIWREGKQTPTVERQMVGGGTDACRIPLVSREYDVRAGDTIFAAAKPGVLDTPIVIGEVAAVQHDEDRPLLWDITVRPIFDRKALANVAVIVMTPGETERP